MTLSSTNNNNSNNNNNSKNNKTFLSKLSTLRNFISSMGMTSQISENELSVALRSCGYNVEVALERILSSGVSGGLGGNDGDGTMSSSTTTATTTATAASSKKRGLSVSSSAALSTSTSMMKKSSNKKSLNNNINSNSTGSTNNKNNKRPRLGIGTQISSLTTNSSNSSGSVINSQHNNTQHHNNRRLLLCKRWTVAISKSIRGKISHSELLHFTSQQNYNSCDPMVRFISKSGNVEGSLNEYLCSILSPLLRINCSSSSSTPTSTTSSTTTTTTFTPLIQIQGMALMEDTNLIIGSEIPLSLSIYINDPIQFFDLFQSSSGETDSKLFFDNGGKKKNTPKMKQQQRNKVKSRYSHEELVDAAFSLLQWAERGEEMPLFHSRNNGGGGGDGKQDGSAKRNSVDNNDDDDDDNDDIASKKGQQLLDDEDDNGATDDDGDYEENNTGEENEELNELNQLVATSTTTDGNHLKGSSPSSKSSSAVLPELSDPIGFKSGIELRPYQRQALHWMCRREGYVCDESMNNGDDDGGLDLLAELAAGTTSSYSSSMNSDPSIFVSGGKAISCDCGPVVVSDDSVASSSIPVADYEQTNNDKSSRKKKKYVHHPLWRRRFLATDDLSTVYSFYVNELLGTASCMPPNPPKQCVGGILADSMGLGKTVMLLSLILTTKEAEDGDNDDEAKMDEEPSAAMEENVDVIELLSDDDDDDAPTVKKMPVVKKPAGRKVTRATTLIIVPLSLISQWEEELATKTNLSYLVYYDTLKKSSAAAFSSVDVVVTTYGTVQSEFKSMSRSTKSSTSQPLLAFDWKRIILDEAHGIKNPSTIVSKACCLLKAESRWAVTGTPIQNSLQDVYGLLKFLRHEPWCEMNFWRKAITSTISAEVGDAEMGEEEPVPKMLAATTAFGRVRRVLAPIILRRTKDTLMEDGTPILTLPPVDSSIVNVRLSDPEREFYNALLERSQSVFEGFLKAGTASKSWFAIFSLLTRLRQACDHVSLTVHQSRESEISLESIEGEAIISANEDTGEGTVNDKFLEDLLAKFKHSAKEHTMEIAETVSKCIQSNDKLLKTECPICFEEPNVVDSIHTPCAHMFCKNCLLDEFREQIVRSNKKKPTSQIKLTSTSTQSSVEGGLCPVCNEYVKVSTLIQIKEKDGEMTSNFFNQSPDKKPKAVALEKDTARETLELALNYGATSSKLDAILNELDEVWKQDKGSKVLVYSQYLGFLDIIGEALKARGVACYRIDGKMSLNERVSMIRSFNKSSTKPKRGQDIERGSVCLGSMKAAGVGLNLVAASSVFIVDPWWNAAVEDQCVNRIHRIGQKAKVVRVRKFVVTDSVEEKIVNLQRKKKGMANEILSEKGDGQLATKPTLEDFKLIFGR